MQTPVYSGHSTFLKARNEIVRKKNYSYQESTLSPDGWLSSSNMLPWGSITFPVHGCSDLSNSLWPPGEQPTKLFCAWNFSGKNTGVSCHFLLWVIFPTQGLKPRLLSLLPWQVDSQESYLSQESHQESTLCPLSRSKELITVPTIDIDCRLIQRLLSYY